MLFALLGSVLYLLGTVLIYGAYGTLDIVLLAGARAAEPVRRIAAALMTIGLLAKTAPVPAAPVAAAGACRCAGRPAAPCFRHWSSRDRSS